MPGCPLDMLVGAIDNGHVYVCPQSWATQLVGSLDMLACSTDGGCDVCTQCRRYCKQGAQLSNARVA
eukprot:2521921-Alexandrium_andersonii.AAC.1